MATSKAENEVSVINVVVKAVRVYSTGDNVRYRVQFDSPFQGYAKDINGNYNLTEIDYIDFVPSVLIAQCLNIVEYEEKQNKFLFFFILLYILVR